MSPLRLSVLMTAYNGSRFLSEAIESILSQTFADFEFIIVDDGSSDSSASIIRSFATRDSRVRGIFLPKNVGIPRAANIGLRAVRAPLVARADSDDISLPRRLERQVGYMLKHPRVSVLGCLSSAVDKRGERLGCSTLLRRGGSILRALKQGALPLLHPSIMLHASSLPRGVYNELFRFGAEDLDLFLRIGVPCRDKYSGVRPVFANLSEKLIFYRQHDAQSTCNYGDKMARNHCYALFSARRRAAGLPDPLRMAGVNDIEQAWEYMTISERACFTQDLCSQKLLSELSLGKKMSSTDISTSLNSLRAGGLSVDRFVWVALSLAQRQAALGFPLQAASCVWRAFNASLPCSLVTLYDSLRSSRYNF